MFQDNSLKRFLWPVKRHFVYHSVKSLLAGIAGAYCTLFLPASADVSNGDLVIKNPVIRVGDSKVNVIVYRNENKPLGPTFLSLHNNEQTLNPIVISNVIERGGSFVALSPPLDNQGNLCRFVRFSIGDSNYFFDPNRIWDNARVRIGISANCLTNELGESPSNSGALSKAKAAVVGFRNDLIKLLGINDKKPNQYLVSVHNNRFLPFDSSVLIPDKCAKRHASKGEASSKASLGDFFLVTDNKAFDFYASRDFNVIWQLDSTTSTEECLDGSLSIYAQSRGIQFATVEVNYFNDGNEDRSALKAQKKSALMLQSVYSAYDSLF